MNVGSRHLDFRASCIRRQFPWTRGLGLVSYIWRGLPNCQGVRRPNQRREPFYPVDSSVCSALFSVSSINGVYAAQLRKSDKVEPATLLLISRIASPSPLFSPCALPRNSCLRVLSSWLTGSRVHPDHDVGPFRSIIRDCVCSSNVLSASEKSQPLLLSPLTPALSPKPSRYPSVGDRDLVSEIIR